MGARSISPKAQPGRGHRPGFLWLALLLTTGGLLAPEGAHAAGDIWETQQPLPTPRRLLAAAAEDGLIYTFGGCGSPCFQPPSHTSTFEETRVEVFDPATATWAARGPIPAVFFGGAAAAPGNGRIYLAGGFETGSVMLEYDPAADTWTNRAPLPTARYGLVVATLDGEIYAVGGNGPSAALEIYDPATDAWRFGAPMPTPRVFLAAAAADGKIFAIGGSPDCCGDSQTQAVEAYDPATDTWTARSPLPVAQQVSAAVTIRGKIYVFGGLVPGSDSQSSTFEYDPATDVWTRRTSMPTARDQAPAVAVDGMAWVLGGSIDCHCQALDTNEKYTPPGSTADLAVTKTNGLDAVAACIGQEITYRITVRNDGPDPVEGAVVRDDFPPALEGITWTCAASTGARCTPEGSGSLDDRVDLPAGGSVTYTARGTLDPEARGRLTNTATVTPPPDTDDPDLSNNRATDDDPILERADLRVDKSNGSDRVTVCKETTYTITVENLGPCPVVGARVSDRFSPELEAVAWTCAANQGADCTTQGGGPIDDLVNLARGAAVTYTATGIVRPGAEGTLSNLVSVRPPDGVEDPDPGNNQARDDDPIVPGIANLGVTKDDGLDRVRPGTQLTYTLTVTNAGPEDVIGARVRDLFPPELRDITWTCAASPGSACDPGSPGQGAEISDLVDMAANGAVTYEVLATVAANATGTVSNTATVSAPAVCLADPDTSDNTATDIDQIAFPDCNSNHVDDALDIARGFSQDINGDGTPDECQIHAFDWEILGVAQGGQITISIVGFSAPCTVVVATQPGEDAATVAANLAAALNADPCLSAQGITAMAMGHALWVSGFLIQLPPSHFLNTDPGLEHRVPALKVPTLSSLGLALLILLLAALGTWRLARQRVGGRR